jgi:hypothetical protein
LQPQIGNRLPEGATWAGDNGCFKNPDQFNLDRFLRWLDRRGPRQHCLFAVAPDVVSNPLSTLARSLPVLPKLRAEGWRGAFVAQDGVTPEEIPWNELDTLFIGGSTNWKISSSVPPLIQEARRRHKSTHMGRVNTRERLLLAAQLGIDSVDGTLLAFGFNANWPKLRGWMACLNAQQSFSFRAA